MVGNGAQRELYNPTNMLMSVRDRGEGDPSYAELFLIGRHSHLHDVHIYSTGRGKAQSDQSLRLDVEGHQVSVSSLFFGS